MSQHMRVLKFPMHCNDPGAKTTSSFFVEWPLSRSNKWARGSSFRALILSQLSLTSVQLLTKQMRVPVGELLLHNWNDNLI